ncbi:MAG TPA: hypothetical protein VH308_10970 [Terracidiphilus sp.]|jgi:hypothetical protein|nr:hypothetical protein [Terracidiphilus sp.]
MGPSRFKSLLRVAIKELKTATTVAKRAHIMRTTSRRLEWAIARVEPEPQASPIDPTTPG